MVEITEEERSKWKTLKVKYNSLSLGKKILIPVIGLFLVGLSGLSIYAVYSYWSWNKKEPITKDEIIGVNPKNPGGELTPQVEPVPSPINGVLFTPKEAASWQKRRPLGVIIENHIASRPPYGLPQAEIIYEAVAEGGITRFLAVYLAKDAERLEPVRSVRTYFLDWLSEFEGMIVHWGGANSADPRTDALGNIVRFGIPDLDCLTSSDLCWRDPERGAPHNGISSTSHLWKKSEERGFNKPTNFESWQFKEEASPSAKPQKQSVVFDFWGDKDHTVRWEYEPLRNEYLRFNGQGGAEIHRDGNTNEQLRAKTVIIQEVPQGVINDGTEYPHLVFETIGEGRTKIFMDGTLVEAVWKKSDRKSRTRYYGGSGEELKFNRGQIWVEILPVGNLVTVT